MTVQYGRPDQAGRVHAVAGQPLDEARALHIGKGRGYGFDRAGLMVHRGNARRETALMDGHF